MHLTYYNLSADPFRLSPDPQFCFPHRTYRKAMTYMRHALLRAEGFIIITGQPGMGKQRTGKDGDDIILRVPVGTEILDEDEETVIADPTEVGQKSLLAKGGNSGFGNLH